MRTIHRTDRDDRLDRGFTLIELIVVVLVIGILAAIAIPAFLAQRASAWEAAMKNDLKNAAVAAETYGARNAGTFAGVTVSDLKAHGYIATEGVELWIDQASTTFEISASNVNLGDETVVTYSSALGGFVR